MSWPQAKLEDVISFIRGVTFKPDDQVEALSQGSTVVMRTKNVQVAGLDQDDLIAIPSELVKRKEQALREGDILISSANSWELVGKASYVPRLDYQATAGGFISIVRAKKSVIDSRYLYHWIASPSSQHKIRHCGRQTTNISNLDVGRFKDLEIPLPPLTEQKRIAAILDKADAIRRKRQQAIQLTDDFLRAVFLDMFGDPVTNPKGWEVRPLGELAAFENGDRSSNYPSGDEIVQSGVLFLSTKNIVSDNLNLRSTQYITEEKYNSLSRGKARKGDLIITLRGTLGSCCIFDCEYDRAFINAQMMIIRPLNKIRGLFLHDLLASKAIKSHFQSIGQGAAVPQLTAKQLKEMLIPLPKMDLQIKYETARTAALSVLEKMSISLGKGLFEALSQKAFSAELLGSKHDRRNTN